VKFQIIVQFFLIFSNRWWHENISHLWFRTLECGWSQPRSKFPLLLLAPLPVSAAHTFFICWLPEQFSEHPMRPAPVVDRQRPPTKRLLCQRMSCKCQGSSDLCFVHAARFPIPTLNDGRIGNGMTQIEQSLVSLVVCKNLNPLRFTWLVRGWSRCFHATKLFTEIDFCLDIVGVAHSPV